VLLAEDVVKHDHHEGDDQPQRHILIERVQNRLPPNPDKPETNSKFEKI